MLRILLLSILFTACGEQSTDQILATLLTQSEVNTEALQPWLISVEEIDQYGVCFKYKGLRVRAVRCLDNTGKVIYQHAKY